MIMWIGAIVCTAFILSCICYFWLLDRDRDKLQNAAIGFGAASVLGVAILAGGLFSQTADTEILNGQVVKKYQETVSCSHSYSCNCRTTGSGNNKTTTCDTCYEHTNDYNWVLQTSVGNINIDRIDRQGKWEPPRFNVARIGDPVAQTETFTNYIRGAQNSLFNDAESKSSLTQFAGKIPPYPLAIYDYHYLNRVLTVGANVPNQAEMNRQLALALRSLGPAKQVNVVILITNIQDPNYVYAVNRAWLGGKKNDVIVLVGSKDYPTIDWVRVISWTDSNTFKIQLRDSLQDLGTLADSNAVVKVISDQVTANFARKHMKDFEYLKSEIDVPTWAIVLAFIAVIILTIGVSKFMESR